MSRPRKGRRVNRYQICVSNRRYIGRRSGEAEEEDVIGGGRRSGIESDIGEGQAEGREATPKNRSITVGRRSKNDKNGEEEVVEVYGEAVEGSGEEGAEEEWIRLVGVFMMIEQFYGPNQGTINPFDFGLWTNDRVLQLLGHENTWLPLVFGRKKQNGDMCPKNSDIGMNQNRSGFHLADRLAEEGDSERKVDTWHTLNV
uniref:Uncharacterized protein n=1 Tax=Steinernema glaseri TaxID=37863 RepID=A0A1I8AKS2_9BILA